MTRGRAASIGMFGLGAGYFAWYLPYSGTAKALSSGILPGLHHPIGGLVLLPAAALGTLLGMPIFLTLTGWWRYSRRRTVLGVSVPFPGRETAFSGFWTAFIVGTTTLNFTFPGASIVFMLVLMRIEQLIFSPATDLVRRRKIHWYSWTALGMSLLSAVIALTDVRNYVLTVGAVLSLAAYMLGYVCRFQIMDRFAKSGDRFRDRRYFVEEHMSTPIMLVLLLAIPALIDQGPWMHALRLGFTTFLTSPAAFPALLIGIFYEGLFVCTSLIYLDPREFSFGMPVNVCASLLAGVVASLGLHWVFDAPQPSAAQFVAAACVILAAFVLSYPTVKGRMAARAARRAAAGRRTLLFVCGGNTSRSPMAAAIARAELGAGGSAPRWEVESAGVSVRSPGSPITPEAVVALRELGVDVPAHHVSRPLTPQMCADTEAVYCMTEAQREAVIAMAPDAAGRTFCLDPAADVADPAGQPLDAYRACARQLQVLVRDRLQERRERYALSGVDGG
jgi:protein-tyrosine-phosphatase